MHGLINYVIINLLKKNKWSFIWLRNPARSPACKVPSVGSPHTLYFSSRAGVATRGLASHGKGCNEWCASNRVGINLTQKKQLHAPRPPRSVAPRAHSAQTPIVFNHDSALALARGISASVAYLNAFDFGEVFLPVRASTCMTLASTWTDFGFG